jgi:hypothetical protein
MKREETLRKKSTNSIKKIKEEKIKGKGRYCVEKDQKLFKKAIRIYSKQEKKDRNQS